MAFIMQEQFLVKSWQISFQLENAIPLRRIQIRDGGKKVNFFLQVSNLLNAAGIWYLEDGGLDTMYIKTYIKESVECIPNWFCYIT